MPNLDAHPRHSLNPNAPPYYPLNPGAQPSPNPGAQPSPNPDVQPSLNPHAQPYDPLNHQPYLDRYGWDCRLTNIEDFMSLLASRVDRLESPLGPIILNEEDVQQFESMIGHVLEFCRDRLRVATVRHAIASPNEKLKEYIVTEIQSCVVELSCHPSGNYVIQDLVINPKVHIPILQNTISVAKNKYGVYVIEALFSRGGSHVKAIISAAVVESLDDLAKNEHGSWIVRQVFIHASKSLKDTVMVNLLKDEGRILSLMNNKFGLYALELFADLCTHQYRDPLINSMTNIMVLMEANPAEFTTVEAARTLLNEMSAA